MNDGDRMAADRMADRMGRHLALGSLSTSCMCMQYVPRTEGPWALLGGAGRGVGGVAVMWAMAGTYMPF